jgi:hypothetical protein
MLDWAYEIGIELNMVLTIKNSWDNKVLYCCENGGEYREKKKLIPTKPPKTKPKFVTKKCGCPFELHGVRDKALKWKMTVHCGFHNHDIGTTLLGHAYVGRMPEDMKDDVRRLTLAHATPKVIWAYIHGKFPSSTVTQRQIYNFRSKIWKEEVGEMTVTQRVLSFF